MVPAARLAAAPGVLRASCFVGRSQQQLAAAATRRSFRNGRPIAQQIVSQARKGLAELLSLGDK